MCDRGDRGDPVCSTLYIANNENAKLRAEIEKLEKLTIPDLKIERDGARYESDKFEKERDAALLQVEKLTLLLSTPKGLAGSLAQDLEDAKLQKQDLSDLVTLKNAQVVDLTLQVREEGEHHARWQTLCEHYMLVFEEWKKALEEIYRLEGPGLDGSPENASGSIARIALERFAQKRVEPVRKCPECGETMPLDPKMACACSVMDL